MVKLISLIVLVGLLSCSQSPTGRHQLKLYSSQQMNDMGSQAFLQLQETSTVSDNPRFNQQIQCITTALIRHLPKSYQQTQWQALVFDAPQINAFALPGGKIGVYSGLLKLAGNSAQVAAVIGHEIGHVIAGHGNERLSSDTLIAQGLQIADSVFNQQQDQRGKTVMAGLGLGLQMGISLPFSRDHETEADIIGLELMAKAGFDPQQAIAFWQKLESQNGGRRQPELLSTHPSPMTRIKTLTSYIHKANQLYRDASLAVGC